MNKLLLESGKYLNPSGEAVSGDIGIENGKILFCGTRPAGWQADEVIDCRNSFTTPGFVNAHTHAAMTLFRSYADDMALLDWLQQKIWPAEAKLVAEDVYWGTQLAIAEMLASGTTAFADMYFFMDQVAKACKETGMRASLSRGLIEADGPQQDQRFEENEQLFADYHGAADGRITVMLGPHAPYTCPPECMKKVVAMAERLGAEIHVHLAETQWEVDQSMKKYGKSPVAVLNELGVFERGTLAAHCVWVSPEDIEVLAAKKVRVVHNPASNMKLASGVASIPEMLEEGITVGLGTDGCASNNNLDMIKEMSTAAKLHKVTRLDPTVLDAQTVVRMATIDGAKTLGMDRKIGSLEAGKKADIILIDLNKPHLTPLYNEYSHLAYAASGADVDTVIINGKVVMENRRLLTINEEEVMSKVREIAQKVKESLRK